MANFIYHTLIAVWLLVATNCNGQTQGYNNDSYTGAPLEQVTNDTDAGFPPIGEDVLSSSLDEGMKPIYDMVKFMLDEVAAVNSLAELNKKVNLADADAVLESLENDWDVWAEHFIVYTVAAVIGILFCLTMPLIGCIICCCRNGGKCGGNSDPMDGKYAKCQRITCGLLLLIFSVAILLAVTSCFLSTKLVRDQTVPTGTMQDISSSLQSIDLYVDNTQEEIWQVKTGLFDTTYDQIQHKLRTFSSDVQTEVGTVTGAEQLFNQLKEYAEDLPGIIQTLDSMQNTTRSLDNDATQLNATLNTVKDDFLREFENCDLSQCDDAKSIMTNLEVIANFTGQDLGPIETQLKSVLNDDENITYTIEQGEQEYYQLQSIVASESNVTISEFSSELQSYALNFYSYTNDTIDQVDEIMDFSKARKEINDTITQDVDDIGYYAYISLNVISSTVLLLATLLFLALLFGCCGDRAGDDAASCNRGNGASSLKVAMVIFFLLSCILMVCTTAMFLTGGIAYTEVCRHFIFKESQKDLIVLDNVITSYANITGASAKTIMDNCEQDMPFYQAFQVEQHYPELNITKALDLSSLDFDATTNELVSQNYTVGSVEMLNTGTKAHLFTVEHALQSINIELYKSMVVQNITSYNLLDTAQLFDQYADDVTNPTVAELFRKYSKELTTIHNEIVTDISSGMNTLSEMTQSVESYDASMNLSVFVPEMESAQDAITSEEISKAVNTTIDIIFGDITVLASSIEFTVVSLIGQCYSVYNAISVSISSVCVSFLYPFNAFWFSLGWCLFFFTLCIPVAFSLMTLYRKTLPRDITENVIGRPHLHRGRSSVNREAAGVRSSIEDVRGPAPPYSGHARVPSPMPSAPPPHYNNGRDNNGYVPDDLDDFDDDDDGGFVEYHRSQGNRPPPSSRGKPIRPTQNYMLELRPRSSNHRSSSDGGYEDYF